jgi:glycosyltransferase involved in cell wall biosynthesis
MKILALTRYSWLGASSRYRFYQYMSYLQQQGWGITVHSLLNDSYIKYLYDKGPFPLKDITSSYINRILLLARTKKYGVIWLQQEAFPWIPANIEKALIKSKIPIVVDYDDAIFHRYDLHNSKLVKLFLKNKIDKIMEIADVVVAGNEYLAQRARKNNAKDVIILPTVVDINNFEEVPEVRNDKFTIGWVGSPSTAKYLRIIQEELKKFCSDGESKLVVLGAKGFTMNGPAFESRIWSDSNEIKEIQSFDVGIMPLADSPWERGKCGFKLIQYMACGKPAIASPVGMNTDIVQHGVNGFLANNSEDWLKYLGVLKGDSELRKRMGEAGRRLVEEKYSLQVNASKLLEIFNYFLND